MESIMIKTVTISGASDDLIEVEGDIREEFIYSGDPDGDLLSFTDGTIVRVTYTTDGVWTVRVLFVGTAQATHQPADGPDGEHYSDRLTLVGDLRAVVYGRNIATAKDAG
jgi:hypothetical protein